MTAFRNGLAETGNVDGAVHIIFENFENISPELEDHIRETLLAALANIPGVKLGRRWLVCRGGFEQFTLAPFGFAHALREARNVDGGNGSGSSMLLRGDLFRTTLQIGEALTVLRKLLQ